MAKPRELSKLLTSNTNITTDEELISTVNSASAYALFEANDYTDNELSSIDLTSTINTASAAAFASASAYTDSSIASFEALPSQSGNAGKYLSTSGSVTSWETLDLSTKADKFLTLNLQAASYPLVLADAGKVIPISNAAANNVTVPLNSSVEFPIGTVITLIQTGAGQTTIVATDGVTIQSENSKLKIKGQYAVAGLLKTDTNIWVAFGNLTA
jgi:hypothetical protein